MEKVVLTARKRENLSKSANNIVRKNGRVPGVYYSKHDDSISIDVSEKELKSLVYTTDTHLINLQIEGESELECIVKDVQFDPITDKVVHFDLLGLTSGETFQLEVPLLFTGSPVGVKEGGVVQQFLHKLDLECMPKDIPSHLTIEIQNLKIGDAIHVSDLQFENVTILNAEDTVIISVTHPKVEAEPTEEEEAVEETVEPELVNKKEDEEES